jgi:thioredoxin 1
MVATIEELSEIPSTGKVVIDFFATWCGPCKRIAPVYVELSEKFPSITFLKCDVDEAEEVSSFYGVQSLPTFLLINNGSIIKTVEGANINELLDSLVAFEKQ